VRYALLYDAATPAGVFFDPLSSSFEWAPDADVVDNATRSDQAFALSQTAAGAAASRACLESPRAPRYGSPAVLSVTA
jgi:hypothetical protein